MVLQNWKKRLTNHKLNKNFWRDKKSSDIKGYIDFDKVAEYKKSMGYYQIVSSELKLEARDIIDKYHGLTQIEDQFRVMKGTLETRPLYVRTPEHIDAHLLICMMALVMVRIIQKRIRDANPASKKDLYWNVGMRGNRIQTALNKWKVDILPGDLYRFMEIDDPDLAIILKAFEIEIPSKLYRRAELKSIKTGIKVFHVGSKLLVHIFQNFIRLFSPTFRFI